MARQNQQISSEKYINHANKKLEKETTEIGIGDFVTKRNNINSIRGTRCKKLQPKYYGSFQVTEVYDNGNAKIRSTTNQEEEVIHVSDIFKISSNISKRSGRRTKRTYLR
ncbi:hypothetical protein SNEBB_001435 [Seison nebaliae]|nr:hypothetical protein SNEBB_001435 [Seison nebaliae]